MAHFMVLLLDDRRLDALKGTGLEDKIIDLFGGALKGLNIEVPEDLEKKILAEFTSARIDSRGAITDVPVAFNRTLFEEVVKNKSIGREAIESVLGRINEIKEAAARESEYLPPPDIEV